jgi:hypothetical protein
VSTQKEGFGTSSKESSLYEMIEPKKMTPMVSPMGKPEEWTALRIMPEHQEVSGFQA